MLLQMTIDFQHTLLEILLATKTTRFPFRSFIVIKFALSPVEVGLGYQQRTSHSISSDGHPSSVTHLCHQA